MGYIRLDKIKATAHLESIVATVDMGNGIFAKLGDLHEEGEAREVAPMVDGDVDIVLVASVPTQYRDDEVEKDFVLKAGKFGRGYVMETGNEVSFSEDLVTGVVTDGAFVKVTGTGVEIVTLRPTDALHGVVLGQEEDVNVGTLTLIRFTA